MWRRFSEMRGFLRQILVGYTPTAGTTFILKHFREFQNPFPRFSIITCFNRK